MLAQPPCSTYSATTKENCALRYINVDYGSVNDVESLGSNARQLLNGEFKQNETSEGKIRSSEDNAGH